MSNGFTLPPTKKVYLSLQQAMKGPKNFKNMRSCVSTRKGLKNSTKVLEYLKPHGNHS